MRELVFINFFVIKSDEGLQLLLRPNMANRQPETALEKEVDKILVLIAY